MVIDWNMVESQIPVAEMLIRKGEMVRAVPPRKSGDTFRGSSIGYMCPREEVLCAIHDVHREDIIGPDLSYIFAMGTGIHEVLQQRLLTDFLVGSWRCRGCGAVYGSMNRLVRMPDVCTGARWNIEKQESEQCPNHNFFEDVVADWHLPGFDYKEIDLHYEGVIKLYSHPDGILWRGSGDPPEDLDISNPYLEAVEFKSASWIAMTYGYGNHDPIKYDALPYHRDQLMLYQYIMGIERGRIIYCDKSGRGILSSFTEYTVELDRAHIEKNVIGLFKSVNDGITEQDPEMAERMCKSKTVARARACPVRKQCWGLR